MTVLISKPAFNLRESLNSIKRKIGLKGAEIMRADTVDDVYNSIGQNRNILINGDFRISQRGDYATNAVSVTDNAYYLDRWRCHQNGVSATVQQTTVTINGVTKYAEKVTATSSTAGGYIGTTQVIENANFPVGKPVTVSAWVRTNNPNCRFRYNGISGSANCPDTMPADGGWHKVSWTINDTSGAGGNVVTIWIIFYSNSGNVAIANGDYFEVADFQVEEGTVATPFERRSYGQELQLCQRYYQKFSGNSNVNATDGGINVCSNWTSSTAYTAIVLPVSMRTAPSFSYSSANDFSYFCAGSSYNLGSIQYDGGSINRVEFSPVLSTSSLTVGQSGWLRINNAAGWLAFSAEI